jgi:hypothetical protein
MGQNSTSHAGVAVTPAMIEAGLKAYLEWEASEDYAVENLVRQIFRRMELEKQNRTETAGQKK